MGFLSQPLWGGSGREAFIKRVEGSIFSGELKCGERLPPEREMAESLGISRPVVHDGLLALEQRRLIEIRPRQGSFVLDYRREGTLELAVSLLRHADGDHIGRLLESMLQFRRLFEIEIAGLAALNRTESDLDELKRLVRKEQHLLKSGSLDDPFGFAEIDYRFHLQIALASGNTIYPMLMNSFKEFYLRMLRYFYSSRNPFTPFVVRHQSILSAVASGHCEGARHRMEMLLDEAERLFRQIKDTMRPKRAGGEMPDVDEKKQKEAAGRQEVAERTHINTAWIK